MATSEVSIANAALSKLGSSRKLESLTQDHPNARTMNASFKRIRDALLRSYTWGFSIRRASIAADGTQTIWGKHNRYSLPNDFLRLTRDKETGQAADWRIEGGAEGAGSFIISDDGSPLNIRYVAKVEDPNAFDSLFLEAFACWLAHDACKEVTGSTDLKRDLKQNLDDAIDDATRVGAIEKPAEETPTDSWVNARL
jgi:hypothetical protein